METAFILRPAAPPLTKTPSALVCQTAIFFFDCNEPSVIWGLAETNLFATSFQPVSHLTRNNVPDVHPSTVARTRHANKLRNQGPSSACSGPAETKRQVGLSMRGRRAGMLT